MRATPPSRRMSEGTRSSAITADAPASSAILACSGVTTSMMTPPRSISASPRFTRAVPVVRSLVMGRVYRRRSRAPADSTELEFAAGCGDARCSEASGSSTHVCPGASWISLPLAFEELRGLLLVRARPRALDLLAPGEHRQLAGAGEHGLGLRARPTPPVVLHEHHDHVLRREAHVVGVDVGPAEHRAQPRAAARVPVPGRLRIRPRNPTTNDLTGVPPTFALAARYVNSGGGGIGLRLGFVHLVDARPQVVRRVPR